jgi:predicted acyl esterase
VLSQSWCSAPVILYGTSYAAHCAVETAIAASAAGINDVGGVSVSVPALGLGETARNVDGAFFLESRVGWWLEHGERRRSVPGTIPDDVLSTLPVADIGCRVDPPIRAWGTVLRATRHDRQRAEQVSILGCPLLAIGGTADWFGQDTIDLWTSWGGPAALVLGPWDHGLRGSARARHMQSWIDGLLAGYPVTGAQVHGLPGGPFRLSHWPNESVRIELGGGHFRSDPNDPFPSVPPGTDLSLMAARSDCLLLDFFPRTGAIIGTPTVRVHSNAASGNWGALLAIRRRGGRLEQVAHGMSPHAVVRLTPLSTHLESGESMVVIVSAQSFPRHARDLHTGDDHLTGTGVRTTIRVVTGVCVDFPA